MEHPSRNSTAAFREHHSNLALADSIQASRTNGRGHQSSLRPRLTLSLSLPLAVSAKKPFSLQNCRGLEAEEQFLHSRQAHRGEKGERATDGRTDGLEIRTYDAKPDGRRGRASLSCWYYMYVHVRYGSTTAYSERGDGKGGIIHSLSSLTTILCARFLLCSVLFHIYAF